MKCKRNFLNDEFTYICNQNKGEKMGNLRIAKKENAKQEAADFLAGVENKYILICLHDLAHLVSA
jgi:hypothetical protein